jgi:hypothetical protein
VVLRGLWAARDAQAFYNPSTGRWLSRDPIAERGGANVYRFAANAPVNHVDANGLWIPGPGGTPFPPPNPPGDGESVGDGSLISWTPPQWSCAKGTSIGFIQVGYGGWVQFTIC